MGDDEYDYYGAPVNDAELYASENEQSTPTVSSTRGRFNGRRPTRPYYTPYRGSSYSGLSTSSSGGYNYNPRPNSWSAGPPRQLMRPPTIRHEMYTSHSASR